jgi:hypothetical protein
MPRFTRLLRIIAAIGGPPPAELGLVDPQLPDTYCLLAMARAPRYNSRSPLKFPESASDFHPISQTNRPAVLYSHSGPAPFLFMERKESHREG